MNTVQEAVRDVLVDAKVVPPFTTNHHEPVPTRDAGIARRPPSRADIVPDEADNHRNAPRADPTCLYGLIGDIARAGSEATEANASAIAAAAIAYLGVAVGRGPYMRVGDTWHHARLFTLHVGRTGIARKGDAVSLVRRIARRVEALDKASAPQIHDGGLSSREGLVCLIHDGDPDAPKPIPAIEDKRLLVIESEFVNVLRQGKREGNTLSSALRDCWDGTALKPATKSNRLWATDPHVGMAGAITKAELLSSIQAREMTNGFANRFLIIWAERERLVPCPEPTPDSVVDELARRVLDVLAFCQASRWVDHDVLLMSLAPDAAAYWEQLYRGELNDRSGGERINALIERRAPMMLRLAMLFALTDCKNTVEVQHLEAALAWMRYYVESVKFIFASAADEANAAERTEAADKILGFIQDKDRATRTQITSDLFQGHMPKAQIDAAIDELLTRNPPAIVVETECIGNAVRPTKLYRIAAKFAKSANFEQPRAPAANEDTRTERETCESWAPPMTGGSDVVAASSSQVRKVRAPSKTPPRRMDQGTSQISQSSLDQVDKDGARPIVM